MMGSTTGRQFTPGSALTICSSDQFFPSNQRATTTSLPSSSHTHLGRLSLSAGKREDAVRQLYHATQTRPCASRATDGSSSLRKRSAESLLGLPITAGR